MVECDGLENRYSQRWESWVRIRPSPPYYAPYGATYGRPAIKANTLIKKTLKCFIYFLLAQISSLSPLSENYYQAIIFDCDGVLVDTEKAKEDAWIHAVKSFGESYSHEEHAPYVGQSTDYIATQICNTRPTIDKALLIKRRLVNYEALQKKGVPIFYEGVAALKKCIALRTAKIIKLGIASSGTKKEILENLRQIGVSSEADFDIILSGPDDLADNKSKPAPDIYLLAAQKLNVACERCLVIEDSGAGVEAGYAAGMDVIAVPNEWTKTHNFSNAVLLSRCEDLIFSTLIKTKSNPFMTKTHRFKCKKLIRDNMPKILEVKDVSVVWHHMNNNEYLAALKEKLFEEAHEVATATTREELLEELSDVAEVIYALAQVNNFTASDIENARQKKYASKGGFEQKVYCNYFEIDEDNKTIEYYRARPNDYPEIKE